VSDAGNVLERLRRYVEVESPNGDMARLLPMADVLAEDLAGAGAMVRRLQRPGVGVHLEARVAGRDPDAAHVVVLGHMDTVWPAGTLARKPFRVEAGRAEGPGIFDMKAGLAVVIEALREMRGRSAPGRPLCILVSCDEESGSATSRSWIEEAARGAAAALVLEPSLPGGRAKTSRKGVAMYHVTAKGRAAHAGIEPERGISAVTELAHQILRIVELADPGTGTTLNVGVVRGGTASNVVAAEAEAQVDVRYATYAEGERIARAMASLEPVLLGAQLAVQGGQNRPPLERTDAVVALYRRAAELARGLGLELGEGATGGGSDGNFVAGIGVPTLDGLGPAGGGAHAEDEHVMVNDLPRRVAFIRRLLEEL
jgi:glutamate carboxypeptidase